MAGFPGLTIGTELYSQERLLQKEPLPAALDAEAKQAIKFCRAWLSGQESFEIQTSGTTDKAKVIAITRERMAASAQMTGEFLKLKPGDRALVCLSPFYIAGIMMLVRGLELSLSLTLVKPERHPFATLDPARAMFDFTALVPLQLQSILNSGFKAIDSLERMKAILVGGAPLPANLEKSLQQIQAPIYQTFGMTETVSHIALRHLNGPEASDLYHALQGIQIGQDDHGCLTVQSAVSGDGVLTTNDIVELESASSFRWLGRADNVINSGGVKVQAEKVERALGGALTEVENGEYSSRNFIVTGLPHPTYGEVVTAVFEEPVLSDQVRDEILEKLSQSLDKYECPKEILYVQRFVRTATSKILRQESLSQLLS